MADRSLYPAGKKTGFYRPHDPELGAFNNTDPDTGEVFASMTKQSEMDACDIHSVLKQFSQTGFENLVRENAARGAYLDLPPDLDYQGSLNTVLAAQAAFAQLPSQVRERFQNNPATFIDFLSNADNQDEAIRLGLATDTRPPKEPETPPTEPNGG